MKKNYLWLIELIIVIGIFAIILHAIRLCISANYLALVGGFGINVITCFAFLVYAVYRVNEKSKSNNHSLQYFLKNKLKYKDALTIFLLTFLSNMFYKLIMKIEFVHFFDMPSLFPHGHLTGIQFGSMILLIILFIPIVAFSEELFFRGYLFDIQYSYFKNYTWIINGLSWSAYHVFAPANFIALLPSCLMYSYVYQKRRNIWITITAHLIQNIFAFAPIVKSYVP